MTSKQTGESDSTTSVIFQLIVNIIDTETRKLRRQWSACRR